MFGEKESERVECNFRGDKMNNKKLHERMGKKIKKIVLYPCISHLMILYQFILDVLIFILIRKACRPQHNKILILSHFLSFTHIINFF